MKSDLKKYKVIVLDINDKEIDSRIVEACSRREAYINVMNEMKNHIAWDADEIKE